MIRVVARGPPKLSFDICILDRICVWRGMSSPKKMFANIADPPSLYTTPNRCQVPSPIVLHSRSPLHALPQVCISSGLIIHLGGLLHTVGLPTSIRTTACPSWPWLMVRAAMSHDFWRTVILSGSERVKYPDDEQRPEDWTDDGSRKAASRNRTAGRAGITG